MMINPQVEGLVLLSHVPNILPKRRGRKINLSTVYRWKNRGLDGVRLETCYRAGRQYTSVEALRRFDEAVTAARNGPQRLQANTSVQRSKAHATAKAKLTRELK